MLPVCLLKGFESVKSVIIENFDIIIILSVTYKEFLVTDLNKLKNDKSIVYDKKVSNPSSIINYK